MGAAPAAVKSIALLGLRARVEYQLAKESIELAEDILGDFCNVSTPETTLACAVRARNEVIKYSKYIDL